MKEMQGIADGANTDLLDIAALCTHENPKDSVKSQYVTNFAIIMDLTEGCFYLAPGNPCMSEFERFEI